MNVKKNTVFLVAGDSPSLDLPQERGQWYMLPPLLICLKRGDRGEFFK